MVILSRNASQSILEDMRTDPTGGAKLPVFEGVGPSPSDRSVVGGFTILEVLFVVMIAVITLGIASQVYSAYLTRTATRRAARIFGRDLALARMSALQTRESVVVRFHEADRRYVVERTDGRRLASRAYGEDDEVTLDSIDLDIPGDSLVFDGRGIADLSGVTGSLGTATFRAGSERYTVSFNSMGASRIGAS